MLLPREVTALIASLQRELESLRAENADLRRRLGLDGSPSSKPPSSDGLKKKPVSLREWSGRPSGGQKGHKGETLRQVAEPDRIVTRAAPACRHCGCALSAAMTAGVERRQVFDLPERLLEVVEHQGLVYALRRLRRAHPGGLSDRSARTRPIWRAPRGSGVYLNALDAVFEAKFMLPWSFSEAAEIEKHMAQLQHNMWVTSLTRGRRRYRSSQAGANGSR
jgi:transposase